MKANSITWLILVLVGVVFSAWFLLIRDKVFPNVVSSYGGNIVAYGAIKNGNLSYDRISFSISDGNMENSLLVRFYMGETPYEVATLLQHEVVDRLPDASHRVYQNGFAEFSVVSEGDEVHITYNNEQWIENISLLGHGERSRISNGRIRFEIAGGGIGGLPITAHDLDLLLGKPTSIERRLLNVP